MNFASDVLANLAGLPGVSQEICKCSWRKRHRLTCRRFVRYCLKGGLFIYALTDFDSRVTVDVDFLLRKMPNSPEQLKAMLEGIIATETGNDFVSFEITDVAPIAVAKKYAGIGASLLARIKNTRVPFSIDFGVGDVIVPKQEKRRMPTQLPDFEAPMVNTYSVETTVAEKLDAILYLLEFSSRMKDYYDIYYIANKFDFDGAVLTDALRKTFSNREHSFTLEQFEQVMDFDNDAGMQKKWKAFVRKINVQTEAYGAVLKMIGEFLQQPFKAAALGKAFAGHWSASDGKWV